MTDPTTRPKRSGPPRSDLFDELWRMIETKLDDLLADALPQMGTVTGTDGGTVKVQLDDEDVGREVGFPSAKGTAYQNGDRVWTHKTKGGARAVLGRVNSSTDQRAVDSPQLYDKAVRAAHIDNGAVQNEHLAGNIPKGKFDNATQRSLDKADSALQNVPGEYVTGSELDRATANFLTSKDLPDTSGLETKSTHAADIKKLNTRIDRLEKRSSKK